MGLNNFFLCAHELKKTKTDNESLWWDICVRKRFLLTPLRAGESFLSGKDRTGDIVVNKVVKCGTC